MPLFNTKDVPHQLTVSSRVPLQDFDIAGSRIGGVALDLESPLGTVTSWDSHAFYKQRIGLSQMTWGVQLHCDIAHLKSLTGIFRLLLVVSVAGGSLENKLR